MYSLTARDHFKEKTGLIMVPDGRMGKNLVVALINPLMHDVIFKVKRG